MILILLGILFFILTIKLERKGPSWWTKEGWNYILAGFSGGLIGCGLLVLFLTPLANYFFPY